MSWNQLHERMAFMADLIDRGAEDPAAALHFNGNTADVQRLFGGEEGLLLALRHRWVTMLTARLDQADHEGIPAAVAVARLNAEHPGLRALLDVAEHRSIRVAALRRSEERIVALHDGNDPGRATVA